MRRVLGIATLPIEAALGAARFARDVGAIAAVAREVEPELRGEAHTARRGLSEALALVRENNELTRETNATMTRVDEHAVERHTSKSSIVP